MIVAAMIGVALIYWAFSAGFRHPRDIDKARVFQGPIGCLVNGAVVLVGVVLVGVVLVLWTIF